MDSFLFYKGWFFVSIGIFVLWKIVCFLKKRFKRNVPEIRVENQFNQTSLDIAVNGIYVGALQEVDNPYLPNVSPITGKFIVPPVPNPYFEIVKEENIAENEEQNRLLKIEE